MDEQKQVAQMIETCDVALARLRSLPDQTQAARVMRDLERLRARYVTELVRLRGAEQM